MSLKRKRAPKEKVEDFEKDVISGRQPFTKGWTQELNSKELLPVKGINGKIIHKKVAREVEEVDPEDMSEDEEAPPTREPAEDEDIAYDAVDRVDALPDLPKAKVELPGLSMHELKIKVATLCLAVTSSPEKSLSRRDTLTDEGDAHPKLSDLMSLLNSNDFQTKEVVMLSVALVFKDICPGYRIRPADKSEAGVQLKKETKQLRDFEKALLLAYQQFLKFLDRSVNDGLGKASGSKVTWTANARFGLSALRCQCELLRTMSHFNFRNLIIESIVSRSAQPQTEIAELCCTTIRNEFKSDKSGAAELCYEIVKVISTLTMSMKHAPLTGFIDSLKFLHLRVHADEMKLLHRKEKQARRKRKKAGAAGEDADAEMLEAQATTSSQTIKRFQADTLQEVSLIYFRIIKKKIGFSLVPAALDGLSKITHLINIDMVEDLIVLLKNLIEATPTPPFMIRLNALVCVFKTLAGPGEELEADDTVFLHALENLLLDAEFADNFERWDILLECVEVGIVKKRLEHHNLVNSIVQLLLLHVIHLDNDTILSVLGVLHALLLRYPRIRASLVALSRVPPSQDEEVVQDVAMQGLLALDAGKSGGRRAFDMHHTDASWGLALLAKSLDPRIRSVVKSMTSVHIVPIPYKIADARWNRDKSFGRIETAFTAVRMKTASSSSDTGKSDKGNSILSKKQRNKNKKLLKQQQVNGNGKK